MTTLSGTINAEFTHIVGEHISLTMQIPCPGDAAESMSNLHAVINIDTSGSMAGGPIRDAKGALVSLIEKFRRADVPLTVYTFNSSFIKFGTDQYGYDGVKERAENIKAGGGTLFRPVVEQQMTDIINSGYQNTFIIWLSDGQDNRGLAQLIPAMEEFAKNIERAGVSCAVNSIGFSEGHDADLLTRLSKSGTRQGTFQYVPPGGRIPVAVNNVFELAFESSVWARFIGNNGQSVKNVRVTKSQDPEFLQGTIYISEDDMEECKLELHNGDEVFVYELEMERQELYEPRDLIFSVASFISNKIKETVELRDNTRLIDRLIDLRVLIDEMIRRMGDLRSGIGHLRVLKRKQLTPFIDHTEELLNYVVNLVETSEGQEVNNVQMAEINNLANKIILKFELEKKIRKRAGQNFIDLQENEAKIDDIISALDVDNLDKEYADAEKLGRCALSGKTWLDALKTGDCLCVPMEFYRPPGGQYEAKLFKPIQVHNLLLSSESFMSSKLFQGKFGQIIEGNSQFEVDVECKPASFYEETLGEEKINAIIPLYINDEHWKIASLRLKQLLGWSIQVDVLGFSNDQLDILPYKIFAKAASMEDNQITKLVMETVKKIFSEQKQTILPGLTEQIDQYNDNPLSRLPDSIEDNVAFLSKAMCAYLLGDLSDKIQTIFPRLIEEQLRRESKQLKDQNQIAIKVFGIPKEEILANLTFEKMFDDFKRASAGELVVKFEDNYKYEDRVQFNEEQINIIDSIHAKMNNPNSATGRLIQMMRKISGHDYQSLSDLGLIEKEQILLLVYQSLLNHQDNTYKLNMQQNAVVDIFDSSTIVPKFQEIYTQAVRRMIQAHRMGAMKEFTQANDQNAIQFAMTDDLALAAQYLNGIYQGQPMFTSYALKLALPGMQLVIPKLKMLTSGQFLGAKLIQGKPNNGQFVTWNPKKSTLFRIWRQNKDQGSLQEWIDAVPGREQYLRHQQARAQGQFVPYTRPANNCKDRRHDWGNRNKQGPVRR